MKHRQRIAFWIWTVILFPWFWLYLAVEFVLHAFGIAHPHFR